MDEQILMLISTQIEHVPNGIDFISVGNQTPWDTYTNSNKVHAKDSCLIINVEVFYKRNILAPQNVVDWHFH